MTLNRPANTHADRPWLAYLQLLRLPNVFTAWADVSMGYLLATGGHASWRVFDLVFVPLIICSSSLYLAGMVLNDVCDYAQDCRQRPLARCLQAGSIAARPPRWGVCCGPSVWPRAGPRLGAWECGTAVPSRRHWPAVCWRMIWAASAPSWDRR